MVELRANAHNFRLHKLAQGIYVGSSSHFRFYFENIFFELKYTSFHTVIELGYVFGVPIKRGVKCSF
jgi:hypothetical protein